MMGYIKNLQANHLPLRTDVKSFRLIFLALLVGLIVGLLSSAFRYTLAYIDTFRISLFDIADKAVFTNWIFPLLYSVIGISVAIFLVKKFAPETAGSGVHIIEGALDEVQPMRWKRVIPLKFIASLFSIGSGALLGREGPTIQLGANVGKMVKDVFKEPDKENNPLVSAGAAAGLASAFNAPLSGIIFVIEEMHGHFKYSYFSVAAIMIASATADFIVRFILGASPVIKMTVYAGPPLISLWMFIVFGIILSLIGYLFNKLLVLVLDFFSKLPKIAAVSAFILIALLIAITGILFPDMIGGGYGTIRKVLDQSITLQFLIFLFIGRFILTIFTYGTGVPGGIFAPLLALGVVLGMLFGSLMQHYFPTFIMHPGVFAVAGMAGIFAATVRAPLTGIVLAVEMTSNFELLLPLIFTALTASLLTTQLGNQPIYTTLLKRSLTNKPKNN